ncbi:caspase-14-like isoform X1 [Mytilus trossulus]|uniref:caspase-14-like isoform X1 n=2 Tax=Mytilus trossulus TaxID=6551 RepID=UPI003003DDE1
MADNSTVFTKSPKGPYKLLEELVAKNGLKMQWDINLQKDEYVAKLILEDEEYSGCGANKKTARDNASYDALMNTKYHNDCKTTNIDKTPVSKLSEFCQNNMQINHSYEEIYKEEDEFVCRLIITHGNNGIVKEEEHVGRAKSKKDAKHDAASRALRKSTILHKSSSKDIASADGSYACIGNQTGYVLIINFRKERDWAEKDEENIIELMSGILKFEYSVVVDPTKAELVEILENISSNLNENYKSYHCFMVFLMAHGSQFGVITADKGKKKITISVDEIMELFKNDKIPNFVGKPKMFFIQSCRGNSIQDTFVQPDDDDDDTLERISAPTDADILIAYATTEGYKAFRHKNFGSMFIYECIQKFKEQYTKTHLEEMMIDVKAALALGSADKTKRHVQMPCTWSTLTKRLYLVPTEW